MKMLHLQCIQVLVLAILVTVCYGAGSGDKRKLGVQGLFPFPRTGRGDPSWSKPRGDHFPAFPRIGRGGFSSLQTEDGDYGPKNSGMWFGPRLGRAQKRDMIYRDMPLAYFIYGDSMAASANNNNNDPFSSSYEVTKDSEENYEANENPQISLVNGIRHLP